jgi:hypothetical protein
MSKSRVLEVASGAGLGDAEAAGADNVFDPGRDAIEQAQPDEEHGHEEKVIQRTWVMSAMMTNARRTSQR